MCEINNVEPVCSGGLIERRRTIYRFKSGESSIKQSFALIAGRADESKIERERIGQIQPAKWTPSELQERLLRGHRKRPKIL